MSLLLTLKIYMYILFSMCFFTSHCQTIYEPVIADNENINCNAGGTLGPDDTCLIKCNMDDDIGDIDCKSAGTCRLECTGIACFKTQVLIATNVQNLEIYATSEECLVESDFYLPNGGNATIIIDAAEDRIAEKASFHSQSTDHIWIKCIDTVGSSHSKECDDININAADAQFLSLTAIGAEINSFSGSEGGVNCPINSNYKGPEPAPCIINATYADSGPQDMNINTKNGSPKDVIFYGNPSANNVYIFCTSPASDSMTYDYNNPFDSSDPCFSTNAPTKYPTTSPTTGAPTMNPVTAAPTSSPETPTPTAAPSKYPTQNPITSAPTANPSTQPPIKTPTQSPSKNPSNPTKYPSLIPTYIPTNNPITPSVPGGQTTGTPTADGKSMETSSTRPDIQGTNDKFDENTSENGVDMIFIFAIIIGILILCVAILIGIIVSIKCRSKSKDTVSSMEMQSTNSSQKKMETEDIERLNYVSNISTPIETMNMMTDLGTNGNIVSKNIDLGEDENEYENEDDHELLYEKVNANENVLPNTPGHQKDKMVEEGDERENEIDDMYTQGNNMTSQGY